MKKLILLVLSLNSFAANYTCKELVDGNINGEAYSTLKKVDIELGIDISEEDAELTGTVILKEGQYDYEGEEEDVFSYFLGKRKFSRKRNLVTVSSYEKGMLGWCSPTRGPCRKWQELKMDLATGLTTFSSRHSYKFLMGETFTSFYYSMKCIRKK